jgi:hypothetical protein
MSLKGLKLKQIQSYKTIEGTSGKGVLREYKKMIKLLYLKFLQLFYNFQFQKSIFD